MRGEHPKTLTPTLTPTLAPTPLPTPLPTLEDGLYVADFPEDDTNDDMYSDGHVRFIVTNGGATAKDAGFSDNIASAAGCSWASYTFDGLTSIVNGAFRFMVVTTREYFASLECYAISTTKAHCKAYRPVYGGCGPIYGIATKQ